MKLFQNIRTYFATMGIYSVQTNQPQSFNIKVLLVSMSLIIMFISTVAFLMFKAAILFDYAFCFYGVITRVAGLGAYLIILFQMRKIIKFIEKCEQFVEKRMDHDLTSSIIMYNKVNAKIEHFSNMAHYILMNITFPMAMIPPVITSYFKFYFLGLNDALIQNLPYMWPFDEKKPLGFLFASIFQFVESFFVFILLLCGLTFLLGSCWLFISFAVDIKSNLCVLNIKQRSKQNSVQAKRELCGIVQAFSDIKEIIGTFNGIYEFIIFLVFTWSMLSICSILLVSMSQLDNLDLPVKMALSVLVFFSFAIIFAFCELGAQVTKQYSTLDEDLCQSKWYMLSIDVQRMILIFMSDTQQPLFLRGYGNILCTRDAFKNTIHSGFSYFMMLRQVDE